MSYFERNDLLKPNFCEHCGTQKIPLIDGTYKDVCWCSTIMHLYNEIDKLKMRIMTLEGKE